MSYDTIGMIRRGWQDGAATVGPHVPGLADLLETRLAEAVRTNRLDETSLLSIVDAAVQLAADQGAVDIAPALSKRLRRHVYEYLLSLDAAIDTTPDPFARQFPRAAEAGGPLIGAEEVAAASRAPRIEAVDSIASSNGGGPHWLPPASAAAEPASPAAEEEPPEYAEFEEPEPQQPEPQQSEPQQPEPQQPEPQQEDPGAEEAEPEPAPVPPQFSFHIGDPDDLLGDRSAHEDPGFAAIRPGMPGPFLPEDPGRPAVDDGPAPRRASFADPSTWPKPVTPTLRGVREPLPEDVARFEQPRMDGPPAAHPDGARFQDVSAWPVAPREEPPPRGGFEDLARWSSPWPAPKGPKGPSYDLRPAVPPAIPELPGRPPVDPRGPGRVDESWRGPTGSWLPDSPTLSPELVAPEIAPSWSERRSEAVELHLAPHPDADTVHPLLTPSDVPESDLMALREAIDQRLRKKRCDDVAAVLQQAAQELGGEAVAELALDAGDRCRTLGKRNAALNCYLAASRADPVYEPPLARLADICIDDQDIDLAVSYLERIARLTRLRGDTRGALRIYRKIATIAPYRDDVLEMLMRAQTTGRIDP